MVPPALKHPEARSGFILSYPSGQTVEVPRLAPYRESLDLTRTALKSVRQMLQLGLDDRNVISHDLVREY